MIGYTVRIGKEICVQTNVIRLSDVDTRLRTAAQKHLPQEPKMVDFLVNEIRRLRGNVAVMRLLCAVIAEIRVACAPSSSIDDAMIDRWRLPLNTVDAEDVCRELVRRYVSFGMSIDLYKIRLQRLRDLYSWEDDINFLRLLFRALAIFEGLDRAYVH